MELTKGEQIKWDIGANLKGRLEYIGGKLKITDENLYCNSILSISKSAIL